MIKIDFMPRLRLIPMRVIRQLFFTIFHNVSRIVTLFRNVIFKFFVKFAVQKYVANIKIKAHHFSMNPVRIVLRIAAKAMCLVSTIILLKMVSAQNIGFLTHQL